MRIGFEQALKGKYSQGAQNNLEDARSLAPTFYLQS
jgi:hypothetical protein